MLTVLSVQTKDRDKGNNRDIGLLTGDNLLSHHLESLHDTPDSIGQVSFHPQLNSTIQLQCREGIHPSKISCIGACCFDVTVVLHLSPVSICRSLKVKGQRFIKFRSLNSPSVEQPCIIKHTHSTRYT